MTVGRLVAIIFIFGCVLTAWVVLGASITMRTNENIGPLGKQVEELWGGEHIQSAPVVTLTTTGNKTTRAELDSSDIRVQLNLEHRRKGLLWYATYGVAFDGLYTFHDTSSAPATATVTFAFPSENTIYDDFEFRVGDLGDPHRRRRVRVDPQTVAGPRRRSRYSRFLQVARTGPVAVSLR